MTITLLCLGKCRQQYVKDGIEEYHKRLHKYCKFEYKEIDENKLNNKILENQTIVALDTLGKELSSEKLAEKINDLHLNHKNVTFIIGAANGLPQEIKEKAHFTLSLSKLTFPNELVRVIFIEQLYRSFTIIKKEKYHKS